MPNFWYVSSVAGTASTATLRTVTDVTVERTGAFTAMAAGDHFPDVKICMLGDATGKPVGGDHIRFADDHNASASAYQAWGQSGQGASELLIQCVKETNCDQSSTGGKETTTGTNSIGVTAYNDHSVHINGADLVIGDDLIVAAGGQALVRNSNITLATGGKLATSSADGCILILDNCIIKWTTGTSNAAFNSMSYGAKVEAYNCSFSAISGALSQVVTFAGQQGGGSLLIENSDLSAFNAIVSSMGGNRSADDNFTVILRNCKLANITNPYEGAFGEEYLSAGQFFGAYGCGKTTGTEEYGFFEKSYSGIVQDTGDDGVAGGIYRVNSDAFPSGNQISYKIATSARSGEGQAIRVVLPSQLAALSTAGEDTITVYLHLPTGTLNKGNCWLDAAYKTSADTSLWAVDSSREADIYAATVLDSDTEAWEDGGSAIATGTRYKISLTITGGADCVPELSLFVADPSITLYACTSIGLS